MDACGRKKRTALTGVLLVLHSEPPPLGRPRSMGHPRRDTRRVPPRWWMLTIMMPSWGGGGCRKVASHAPCPRVGDDGKGGVLVGAPQRQREWQANSLRRMTAVSLPSSRIPPPRPWPKATARPRPRVVILRATLARSNRARPNGVAHEWGWSQRVWREQRSACTEPFSPR